MRDMNAIVGRCDLLLLTLDTLRYDVAQQAWEAGELPVLGQHLPATGWERRHTPANFTYAAHHAFFAGFLPTPIAPGLHPRLFAAEFAGSETTTSTTHTFREPNIVAGLATRGYHTLCIGGVGFFNKRTALGSALPAMFEESHWSEDFGVTCAASTEHQVQLANQRLLEIPATERVFLFINIAAIHQPNCGYVPGATADSLATHRAALRYVDRSLAPLLATLKRRAPFFAIVCSDHGTAYGEDGYHGHRLNHPVVGEVPYFDFLWES